MSALALRGVSDKNLREGRVMRNYYEAAMEKSMTRQEIILRVYAKKKISWIEAAEILGTSCRHLRRVKERYEAGVLGIV